MSGRLVPIYVDGDMSTEELRVALATVGYMLRADGHRFVVTRVPRFLRHSPISALPPVEAEIIPMRRAGHAKKP